MKDACIMRCINILMMFYQNGFQKGHRAQHKLIFMIEKFRKIRDNKGAFAAVLTDLSQASEFI